MFRACLLRYFELGEAGDLRRPTDDLRNYSGVYVSLFHQSTTTVPSIPPAARVPTES